ncbi:MAG: 2-phosphosulfolactate phosphatase [Gemmatimonadota bacterium]|nr:2-phosphosulfolactate phosphatase [Gemmatimonadota bacterium]
MRIYRKSLLSGAESARETAVVIDVFRAFTCASIMLGYGLSRLLLEEDPGRVLELKRKHGYIALGEMDGKMVEGFDLGNSPVEIAAMGKWFFEGKTVVQRTSSGVRGIFAAVKNCHTVYAGSYTTAPALAAALKEENPVEVHLVAMGWKGEEPAPEDELCAGFIHSLLDPSIPYDHLSAMQEILSHESAQRFLRNDKPYFPPADIPLCLQTGLFEMAMKVETTPAGLELRPRLNA